MKNRTTADDLAQFSEYMQKWQLLLNLHDWRIVQGKRAVRGAMADVSMDHSSKMAIWRLGRHFGRRPGKRLHAGVHSGP